MRSILISLSLFSTVFVSGCVQTHDKKLDDTTHKKAHTVKPESENLDVKLGRLIHTEPPKTAGIAIEHEQKIYWVKKPGVLVYNGTQEMTRSLRLQPTVAIHKEVDGWGLINPSKDEWVNMSDLTNTKPDGMLARPQENTGRPRITVKDK